jgi:MbtH protein
VQDDAEDTRPYLVVINDEEQFSIWLADRAIPAGWRAIGDARSKAECLDYIERNWTDMRPLSVRKRER